MAVKTNPTAGIAVALNYKTACAITVNILVSRVIVTAASTTYIIDIHHGVAEELRHLCW